MKNIICKLCLINGNIEEYYINNINDFVEQLE